MDIVVSLASRKVETNRTEHPWPVAAILEGEDSPRNRSNHPLRTASAPQTTQAASDHLRGLDLRQWSRRLDLDQDCLTGGDHSFPALVLFKPKAPVSTQKTELGSLYLFMSLLCFLTLLVYSIGILGSVAKYNLLGLARSPAFALTVWVAR